MSLVVSRSVSLTKDVHRTSEIGRGPSFLPGMPADETDAFEPLRDLHLDEGRNGRVLGCNRRRATARGLEGLGQYVLTPSLNAGMLGLQSSSYIPLSTALLTD